MIYSKLLCIKRNLPIFGSNLFHMSASFKSLLFSCGVFWLLQSGDLIAQQTVADWNFPNNPDNAIVDLSLPSNTGITISTQGGTTAPLYNYTGATSFAAGASSWQSGSGLKWWEITFDATGLSNLELSSKQYGSSTAPRDFKVQYRIGAGVWTDLPGATAIVVATNWTTGVINGVALPAACNNQPAVSLRWIMTSNTAIGGAAVASSGVSRIDDINVSWNADEYYRSAQSGNWNNITTWESSPDNISWSPAIMAPTNFSRTITIRNPHTVTINSRVRMDETIVQNGATLSWASFFMDINNGPGVDLQVNGTLWDNATNNVAFIGGATWSLGAAGTVLKTNNGSANNWRDNYNGGIATIPATATWIIRKISGNNPSVSSLTMYYPNLLIENNTASPWIATGSSSFQGAGTTIVVKGYMDVGGSGSNTVEFESTNINPAAVVVTGNLHVRSGNTLRNYGTGFELFSNLICDGNITYDASDSRQLIFSGGSPQVITGAGNLNVFRMVMNKSAGDVTLFRPVKVDNNITFNNPGGRIFTDAVNLLTVDINATATGANNSSFVHGPVRKLGTAAFTFPTGKNNSYRSIGIGSGSGGGGGVFWTEEFGSGCNTGQLANSYAGTNGTWNIVNTGTNEVYANTWYISAAENGQGAGVCGAGCGSNQTLHVSSTFSGDLGAAYFESDPTTCSFFGFCGITDKRVESPVINCTGQSGINLSFNYMEYGEGTADNATLWYFDGTSWSQLIDLPKTLCCGGVVCDGLTQGLWTAYSIALPASANNNPNIRIGFRWVNNGNGVGTDPSFAVDDVRLSGAGATETFTAEYFRANPQAVYNNVVNAPIDHISQCEYWTLTRDAGTSARTVTLSWDANSCGVTLLTDLTTARFNGTSWDDRGNGGTTGTLTAGTVTTSTTQTDYGPFTLASTSFQNPLPVELLSLDAKWKNQTVEVNWTTASEINSDYFLIQRSASGQLFENIGSVQAAGNTTSLKDYSFFDYQPLKGTSYYRLQQFDFDGSNETSQMVAVKTRESAPASEILNLYTDPFHLNIHLVIQSTQSENVKLSIVDVTGRIVLSEQHSLQSGRNALTLPAENLARGVYTVRILLKENQLSGKFFW